MRKLCKFCRCEANAKCPCRIRGNREARKAADDRQMALNKGYLRLIKGSGILTLSGREMLSSARLLRVVKHSSLSYVLEPWKVSENSAKFVRMHGARQMHSALAEYAATVKLARLQQVARWPRTESTCA